MNKKKSQLINKLKDKEYRKAFVGELINTGIPFQILALREQRNLTQEEFGRLVSMQQEMISRIEDHTYGNLTLRTLKKIASGLDIGLLVKFVSFSELVEQETNLTPNSLKALSFDNDSYFTEHERIENHMIVRTAEAADKVISLRDHIEKKQTLEAPLEFTANERKAKVG